MLRIYNTQTHQKEIFQPLEDGKVRIYICGPVIYKEIQLEQVISALVFDVIRRYLEYRGYDVRYAMSFTDLNDKIISRSTLLEKDPCRVCTKKCVNGSNWAAVFKSNGKLVED